MRARRTAETSRRRALAATLLATGARLLAAGGESAGPSRDAAGAIAAAVRDPPAGAARGDCVENMRIGLEPPDGGDNGVPTIIAVPCTRPRDGEVLRITQERWECEDQKRIFYLVALYPAPQREAAPA